MQLRRCDLGCRSGGEKGEKDRRAHGVAKVELAVTDESLIGPARVHRRHRAQRFDDGLRDEGRRRQVEAFTLLEFGFHTVAISHQVGHVDLYDGVRVRRGPRLHHVVRDRAPHL